MTQESATHQKVNGLFKLSDVRLLRQAGLLNEQREACAELQRKRQENHARMVECRHSLSLLTQQWQKEKRLTAHQLQIRTSEHQARLDEIKQHASELGELTKLHEQAKASMHVMQKQLHAMKLHNDALRQKLGLRLNEASRRREARYAEIIEDEFAQRGYR